MEAGDETLERGHGRLIYDLIVIGGGAAGFFAAINAKNTQPSSTVILLEKTAVLLSKVRISGGGRCNVTHSCFSPPALVQHYPRGSKELLAPFQTFQPDDTVQWFESRGVRLKTEPDGRMFPVSDQSETIIECLLSEASKLGVEIALRQRIDKIAKQDDSIFAIHLKDGMVLQGNRLILATGNSPEGHAFAEALGHSIKKPVPSLFTFNSPTSPLKSLSGISVENVELKIGDFVQTGPLLITHFGFSGPAALKLSAWGARYLHEKNYHVELIVNWLPQLSQETIFQKLSGLKSHAPQRSLHAENLFTLPKNLWKTLLEHLDEMRMNDISLAELRLLSKKLHASSYQIEGKTTNKEEFVTCGGVNLKEVNFKTMQSKLCPGLFFAGEILDIDGVTGGFNFQNAWTTGFIAGLSLSTYQSMF